MKPLSDRFSLTMLVIGLLFNASIWGLILWKIPYTTETVLLHYNIFFGVDATGSWYQLFAIPGSGVVILLINGLLILRSQKIDLFLRRTTAILTAFFQAILLVASLLIVLLNH